MGEVFVMEFVFDLQRFAKTTINWSETGLYVYTYTEPLTNLNLNSVFDTDPSGNQYIIISLRNYNNDINIDIFNETGGKTSRYSGLVSGNIKLQDDPTCFCINGLPIDITSKGEWKLEASVNEDGVTVNTLVLVVDGLTLNENTFSNYDEDTNLSYDKDGKITQDTEKTAVTVTRKDIETKDSYTVTVNDTLSVPLIIDGVTATVTDKIPGTDSSTGTEYQVKDGPTFTATDSFIVASDGVFIKTGSGLTVTSGSVTTWDENAKIDISKAEDDAKVTFYTGTAANGAVITTKGGSITLTEFGGATETVVKQDGSISGLDGSVTVTGVPAEKSVTTIGAGVVSVNDIVFTSTDGVTVTPDGVTATTLNTGDLAAGQTVTVVTANKDYSVAGTLYRFVSAGVRLTGTAATLGKGKSVTVSGHDALTNNGETAVTIGSDGAIKLAVGQQFTLGDTIYNVSTDTLTAKVNGGTSKTGHVVTITAGEETNYYLLTDDQLNTGVTITDVADTKGESWEKSSADLLVDNSIVTSYYTTATTTYFLANGLPLANSNNAAAVLNVDAEGKKTLQVKSAITAGVETTDDTVAVTDADAGTGTDTVYTLAKGVTMTAKNAAFTTTSGIVSDVKGTLTVRQGTISTNDGRSSVAYNLADGAGVAFSENSATGAVVTALDAEGKAGDTVTVNGNPRVVSNKGNAEIYGLCAVGDRVEIKDNTGSANKDTITYEVVCDDYSAPKINKTVVRRTDGSGNTSYYEAKINTVFTDAGSDGSSFTDAPINISAYVKSRDFLYNGIPVEKGTEHKDVAASLTVDKDGKKTLQVKSAIKAGVVATGDTVNITDAGTQTAYTLDDNSHITADGASYTTTAGVVSKAKGTLTLTTKDDSLKAKGNAKVDASALTAAGATGTITYEADTALKGNEVILGTNGQSMSLTEEQNLTNTVYDGSKKTLSGVDNGAVISTASLTDKELSSINTAGAGTFTINDIGFASEEAVAVTSIANTENGTLTVNKAITTKTKDKNYQVEGTLYKEVSAEVELAKDKATLDKDETVTVDNHDQVTNKADVRMEVSSAGAVKLAKGMNFTMGDTTYTVDSAITEGYVGTEEKPIPKEGYVVTVTTKDGAKRYILSEEELSAGVSVTDKQSEQGEVWADADEDLLLPSIPLTVNASSESAAYNNAGFVTTKTEDTVATVTKKDDGTYTVAVTGKVLLGVEIDGVKATLTDSGSGTEYKTGNGTFQLSGTGTLENGLLTFDKAGSSVTINGYTYTFDKVNDKVSLDATGKLTGLTDGEKVTVTNKDGATITYEVSGGELLLTKNEDGKTTTTTNLLAAGETDGFIILEWKMEAVNRATETSKTQDDTGLEVNTEGVDKITDGIMLDKSGQATLAEDKAIATVTIQQDDSLKYTAKENKGQDIKITEKSSKTWEINASNKKDTIEYEGRGEAVIFAGDGNDNVSITGSGDVQVFGENGKNTITHTGSGDATIVGGSGNDTIKSTHAEDTITGGEGKNTFLLTNVETHVSDFTYGQDKAVVTSKAGPLDITKLKATPEGTISYTGTGNTGGSLNVAGQGYGDFYAANLTDANGKNNVNVGWTGEKGGMIDASSLTDKVLLLGNSNGVSDSLIGGKSRDTIVAGNGASSLWGGAGSDLIESNDEASHTIFFLEGDGNDTVTGFTTYGDSSSDNPDTMDFLGQGLTAVKNTSQGFQLRHESGRMLLSGTYTANTMFKWESGEAGGIAKIGRENAKNNLTYKAEVTNYLGSTAVDTLTIGADEDNLEVWLDGSHGKTYDSVEILDAGSTSGAATLAGGAGANTIIGGKGNSSLWGGSDGANDLLKGGTGEDVFFYGQNEGNDTIKNASAEDKVMLYNLGLGDLQAADIGSNKVTITQQNGQTLNINGRAGEFTLSDGSTWAADYSTKTWNQVK